jgi:uncharacterized membrane protein YtjA (UPF0391 family)
MEPNRRCRSNGNSNFYQPYLLSGGRLGRVQHSAGVLGLSGIAGTATHIAWILFVVFLVLFVVSLVMGRRPPV